MRWSYSWIWNHWGPGLPVLCKSWNTQSKLSFAWWLYLKADTSSILGFFLCFSLASWQGRFQEFLPEVMAPCLEKWSACSMSMCPQFSSKERQHQVFPAQLLCLAFPCVAISCQEKEVSSWVLSLTKYQPPECSSHLFQQSCCFQVRGKADALFPLSSFIWLPMAATIIGSITLPF